MITRVGQHPDHVVHGDHPDLAVTDPARPRGGGQRLDGGVQRRFVDQHLHPHLRDEVDLVLGAPVDLGVAALTTVALRLRHRHTCHPDSLERGLHRLQGVRLDDRGYQLHGAHPPTSTRPQGGQDPESSSCRELPTVT